MLNITMSVTNVHIRVFQRRLRGCEDPSSCKIGNPTSGAFQLKLPSSEHKWNVALIQPWEYNPPTSPHSTQPLAEKLCEIEPCNVKCYSQ